MTTDVEMIERETRERFAKAGLSPFLVENSPEIVLSDRAKVDEATNVMRDLLRGTEYSLVVRSKWFIEKIGDLAPAYGQSGGLKAAVLIPLTLSSGSDRALVTVAVTKLAEMEFNSILGQTVDLKRVAQVVVESALRRGGRGFWDPATEDYLEVASGSVANISRLLKRTA